MNKLYDLITWHNNTTPAINEDNLNAMSQAIDDIDDRVIDIAGTIMETVPEIMEKYADIEALSENPPYIGANGNWYVWDTNTGAYVDSGVDASITVSVGTTSTLPAGSSATVTNSGTSTDPILNFGIPQGAKGDPGEVPITKYTQTLSAGSTSVTFTNVSTTANSIIEVATDKAGLEYNAITNSGSSYTVTFDSQSSSVTVYLLVTEVA